MKLDFRFSLLKNAFYFLIISRIHRVVLRFILSSFIIIGFSIGNNVMSKADFATLEPCAESSAFHKRLVFSTKKLENKLKLYSPNSNEALALKNKIELTKRRFKNYENSTLLCGKEGLPRIIVGTSQDHRNEFMVPALLFLYIAGWIGWVSRNYLRKINEVTNSYESEIIINVPLALSIMPRGYAWPIEVAKEFTAGLLVAQKENITVSPR